MLIQDRGSLWSLDRFLSGGNWCLIVIIYNYYGREILLSLQGFY